MLAPTQNSAPHSAPGRRPPAAAARDRASSSASRSSRRSAPSSAGARERGQAQARDRSDRRRPAQAQPAAHRHRRPRARRRGPHRRDRRAPQAARRQRAGDCANRWTSGAPSSPKCWRPCSASAGGRRPPSWSGRRMRCRRCARPCMLGAVLPEMRAEAEALVADLAELVRAAQARSPRSATSCAAISLALARRPPAPDAADRRAPEAAGRGREGARRPSASAPPTRAPGRQPQGPDRQARAGPRQRRPRRPGGAPERRAKPRTAGPTLAALNDPGRLAPAIAFASAKGTAAAARQRGRKFANSAPPTASEAPKRALSIATRPGAQVTAPVRRLGGLCRAVPQSMANS